MSLSAVFSATSCQRASIAFVTTDFWPSLPAQKTLRERASYSPCQNRKASLTIPPALTRQQPAHIPVHAAAAACSSSRPSRPAASRTTDHRRQPSPSDSTPHDHRYQIATTQSRSPIALVLDRLR